MILKFAIDSGFGRSWELIDDVVQINYSFPTKEQRQGILSEPNRYIQEINEKNGKLTLNQRYVYVIATLNGKDKYFSLISNLNVYLLNSEGKTIERLN
jgi:hypothetical protein